MPAILDDISGGGVSFVLHDRVMVGEFVNIRLVLPEIGSIEVLANIVRVIPLIENFSIIYRAGVEFSGIDAKSQAMIVRFVNSRLLNQKNAAWYVIDPSYGDYLIDQIGKSVEKHDSIRKIIRNFENRLLEIADRSRSRGSRFGIICSRSLHAKVLRIFGNNVSPPLLLTPDEFLPASEELSRLVTVYGSS